MVNRKRFIGIKVTQEEYEHILKKAGEDKATRWKTGGQNLSAYIRKCVLHSSGFEKEIRVKKELDSTTYQIRKIGVNINQAVKKINTNFYDIQTTEKLYDGLDAVNQVLRELIKKLEDIDGGNKTNEY